MLPTGSNSVINNHSPTPGGPDSAMGAAAMGRSYGPQEMRAAYLEQRGARALRIQNTLAKTSHAMNQMLICVRVASWAAALIALTLAVGSAVLSLSAGLMVTAVGLLFLAQVGTAIINQWTAKKLREAAAVVRVDALECIALINFQPWAAVLDARWPHDSEDGVQLHPWREVIRGLSYAAAWQKLANQYQTQSRQSLASLIRSIAIQCLKGAVALLAVLNASWDLMKLIMNARAVRIAQEPMTVSRLVKEERDLFSGSQLEALTLLQCLQILPNHQEIERWRRRLCMTDSAVDRRENRALQQWRTFADHFRSDSEDVRRRYIAEWISSDLDAQERAVAFHELNCFAAAARTNGVAS